jgi:hypothetical protein
MRRLNAHRSRFQKGEKMQTQKVDIPVNVPIPVTLASLDGVLVDSQFGPGKKQMRFATAPDGKALYVPTWVGDQVMALGSRNIRLTKAQDAQRRVNWKVEKIEGEQPNGTFVIQKPDPATSPEFAEPGLPIQSTKQQNDQSLSQPRSARKRILWDAGRELVDAHAALMKYATEKHPGVLTSYDVRTYLVTTFIQASGRGQAGGRR